MVTVVIGNGQADSTHESSSKWSPGLLFCFLLIFFFSVERKKLIPIVKEEDQKKNRKKKTQQTLIPAEAIRNV